MENHRFGLDAKLRTTIAKAFVEEVFHFKQFFKPLAEPKELSFFIGHIAPGKTGNLPSGVRPRPLAILGQEDGPIQIGIGTAIDEGIAYRGAISLMCFNDCGRPVLIREAVIFQIGNDRRGGKFCPFKSGASGQNAGRYACLLYPESGGQFKSRRPIGCCVNDYKLDTIRNGLRRDRRKHPLRSFSTIPYYDDYREFCLVVLLVHISI